MANTTDELFEEEEIGGPDEMGFEIDMAVEDALLADDFDESKKRYSTEILKHEEEDMIDISIGDEIQDEMKSTDHGERNANDEERNKERQRFKTERNIVSRPVSSIPDSLDAVPVKTDYSQNRRGRKGNRGGGMRQRPTGQFMPPPQMLHQPASNIHVNPHFKNSFNLGGALWDGQNQQQYQDPRPMHLPYDAYGQPPPPQRFWPEGPPMPDYYQSNEFGQNDFYQQDSYYQQPHFGPPPGPPPNWDQNFYSSQPPPHYQGPPPNFQGANFVPPPSQPQMRPHFNPGFPRPPGQFGSPQKHQNKFVRPTKMARDVRQDTFREKNAMKQQRFENSKKNRNLQEIKTQDVPSKLPKLETEEEDEDMRLYRLKIEEQKKLRETLLKQKEEKRKMAAQQKTQEEENSESSLIKVRLKANNGEFIIKNFTPEQFARLKKLSQEKKASLENGLNEPKTPIISATVLVENLSASTTKKQLEEMAKTCGAIKDVTHDMEAKKATIRFETVDFASEFNKKFHRKMVDLSMINVRLVQDIENE